jgi:hypothetical protein
MAGLRNREDVMALTNAEKQRRWRERRMSNTIVLASDPAAHIAENMILMEDQAKLRQISRFINEHLKHPDRTAEERAIVMGRVTLHGLHGPLGKPEALKRFTAKQTYSFRVEATTKDGQRWHNGVRLKTREEAETYMEEFARRDLEEHGYVTAEVIRRENEEANNLIYRKRKGGRRLHLAELGDLVSLKWKPA